MVATGGTAIAAVNMVLDSGVPLKNIRFLCLNASMTGLSTIMSSVPGLRVWIACVDAELSKEGYILPGLGVSLSSLAHSALLNLGTGCRGSVIQHRVSLGHGE